MAGSRHGNVFWEEEKGNVGLRMMQSMGWEHGKGLGSRGHGVTSHIRVRQKKDNAGIGANAATADDAWKATQDVFNSILTRLNDKDAVAAVDKEEKTQSTPTVKQTMARHQLYRKFRAAKNAAEYSATDMAMIFGRRADETGNDDGRSRGGSGESAPDSGHQTTVSTVCMRTYFQMRMRDASGGAPPTASERMGGSAGFTEEFQVSFAHEMTTRAEAYVGRQGLGFAASAGRGARGTLPAAPQHEPCAPAQALVQTPPGSDAKPAQASNRECTRADAGVAGGKRRKLAAGEGDADKPNMKRAIRAVMAGSDARGMKLKLCCARLVAHFGGALSAERVAGLLDERKARKAGFEIVGKRIRRRAAD